MGALPRSATPVPSSASTRGYLAGLNPEQLAAVTAEDGPLLVLAGAGTGKTRVLTTRLAHVLLTGRARPAEVLAVTFTNRAAREMAERVEHLVGGTVAGMWLGTFHAMGARMLRIHAELVGLQPSFTILDADDQQRLAKQVLQAAELDERRWPARLLVGIIQRWKDRGYRPDQVPAAEAGEFALGRGVELYRAYQQRLATLNACDFGDLLLHCLTLLNDHPDVLAQYQRRFRAILVDEYQDTNVAQYLWLRLLAAGHKNVTCVGDDDQSIYSWRGAEVGNILRFEQDFPGAQVVRLERNYRSTGHILGAASGVIARNRARHGKTLWTEGEAGEPVRVAGLWDDQEEARFVADEVEAWQRHGGKLSHAAVLVRAGFQTRSFEERFIQLGVPYRVIGGPRFYERAEICDAIAYLRVVCQPDDDLALERIVNLPRRGIGDSTLRSLRAAARGAEISLYQAARAMAETDELPGRARNALRQLLADLDRWRADLRERAPRELAERVLDESGYTAMWQAERSPDAPGRLENLKELVKAVQEFDTLPAFLEHVSLVMDNAAQAEGDLVTIMTLHGAKGLEFDNVFLAGWEEGLFPSQRSVDEGGTKALEEERRLAYVGITRARRRLTISFAANRRVYNQWSSSVPSRFVDELPAEHIEHLHRNPATRPDLGSFLDDEPFQARPTSRFRSRRAELGKLIEGKAEILQSRPPGRTGDFKPGDRIFHDKFGYGKVEAVDGNKLDIEFEHSGRKKVIDSFVQPAEVMTPDPYLWRLTVETTGFDMPELPEAVEDEALSVSLFEIEDERTADTVGWQIDLLFREPPDADALASALAAAGMHVVRTGVERVEPEEWARATELRLSPITAGRFVVHGSHARDAVPAGAVGIEVDAGLAFGSGEHATTQACLASIDLLARRRRFRRVLDVGCGSGVLAIAAAKCWPARVLAVDNDPIAVRVARANAELNNVAGHVRVELGEGYGHPAIRSLRPFDLVLANILADPLIELAPALARHLTADGHAVLSGLLDRQADAVIAAHRRVGLDLIDRADRGPWVALVFAVRRR